MKIKRQLNFVNASHLFTHFSYLGKTYTTTAQEPSIYQLALFLLEYSVFSGLWFSIYWAIWFRPDVPARSLLHSPNLCLSLLHYSFSLNLSFILFLTLLLQISVANIKLFLYRPTTVVFQIRALLHTMVAMLRETVTSGVGLLLKIYLFKHDEDLIKHSNSKN